jgi:hypothetical protein
MTRKVKACKAARSCKQSKNKFYAMKTLQTNSKKTPHNSKLTGYILIKLASLYFLKIVRNLVRNESKKIVNDII